MNVTKRPVISLLSSCCGQPIFDCTSRRITITTANNESLTLTGQGSIQRNISGTTQNISLGTLSFSDGTDQLRTIHFLVEVSC